MAAPNLLAPNVINGKTAVLGATTSEANLLVNAASSNQALKVNTLLAVNNTGAAVTLTVLLYSAAAGGTATAIARTESIAANSRLTLIDKGRAIWLEENRRLVVVASASASIDVMCSYEEVS